MSEQAGIGLPTLLTVVFVVLKLTGVIAWSWLWVLSPIWISLLIAIVLFMAFAAIMLLATRSP